MLLPRHFRNKSYYPTGFQLETISVLSGGWETWCTQSIMSTTVANNVALKVL